MSRATRWTTARRSNSRHGSRSSSTDAPCWSSRTARRCSRWSTGSSSWRGGVSLPMDLAIRLWRHWPGERSVLHPVEPMSSGRDRRQKTALSSLTRLLPIRAALIRVRDGLRPRVDDSDFMRETSAAALQGARPQAHWILWSTVVFLAVGVIWANRAELDEVAVGQGRVIPSSRIQVVQNLEGGIVAEILVEAGQIV